MLGVDLGTSHTVAMLRWPDGRVRPLLFDGQPLLPSAVYRDTTGRLHVGHDAVRLGYAEPARLEPNPKRHVDAESVLLGGAEVPVSDLLAALLEAIAREAVAAAGFLPPAVVTYPAAWGTARREVLTRALARAGWPPETPLVPEPVAAARYFAEVLRRPVPVGAALAVFDFGGGTLDIAVVRHIAAPDGRSRFEVVASGGLDDLGGLDIDAALVDHLGMDLATTEPDAWEALREPATLAQWRARRHFWDDVRGAKEMLSRAVQAPVAVPGLEHAVHLTRDELELVTAPLVRRGVAEAGVVIKAAGLSPADLAGLFLVGGSSRVPLVARLLHSELGVAPTVLEQPELPVAEGAMLAGGEPGTETAPEALRAAPVEPMPDTVVQAGPAHDAVHTEVAGFSASAGPPADSDAGPPGLDSEPGAGPSEPGPGSDAGPSDSDSGSGSGSGPRASVAVSSDAGRPPAAAAGLSPGGASPGGSAAAGSFGAGEPSYAEPVDPWAIGEAAALAAGHGGSFALSTTGVPTPAAPTPVPPPGEPWLASAQPPPEPVLPPYRRKGLWIVAAATVVVLGVAATVVALFWPGYSALDYQPLSEPRRVKPAVPVTSAFSAAALRDGRAYFASAGDNGQLGVVAAAAGSGETLWSSTEAGAADRWEFFFTLPRAVVAISATDSETHDRRMVLLEPVNGRKMWERRISSDDSMLFTGDTAVLVDRAESRLVGLEVSDLGRVAWEQDNPKSEYGQTTTKVVTATTSGDFAGAATTGGVPFAAPMDDDERLVQIGADRSARVFDASTGDRVAGPRLSVADPGDEVIAHDGRLIVAESGSTRRIVVYDLGKLGEPEVPYTAPDNSRLEHLTACGDDRVCFVQKNGYDSKAAQVVAIDVAKGGKQWSRPLPETNELVPVGDTVLAAQNTSPGQVSLLGADGSVAWTRTGAAARLDGGNLLFFSKALSTSADDPALSGEHVGDAAVPLGSLAGVRSATCAWDQKYLACVAEKDFVLHTFAS
ncbi:Hsp70 family protein [Actinoplanes sp. NPDC051346]|uniref:Hsp70 family protein n=1 Tax=Actinoplanes sp. NPDC051346 TaxID=3155048 RepID=UPI00343337F1